MNSVAICMALITLNPLMTVWELAAMLVLTGSRHMHDTFGSIEVSTFVISAMLALSIPSLQVLCFQSC